MMAPKIRPPVIMYLCFLGGFLFFTNGTFGRDTSLSVLLSSWVMWVCVGGV